MRVRVTAVLALVVVVWLPARRELLASQFDVVISEIHYNVFVDGEEERLEFIELWNRGGTPVDLSHWSFSKGVAFSFPRGTVIGPQEHLVVAADPEALRNRHGLARVAGPFIGRLDNGGEIIELVTAFGDVISRVHYTDEKPWPRRADGWGPSLEFTGTDNGNDQASRWKSSRLAEGTPGRTNSTREQPPVLSGFGGVLVAEGGEWSTFRGTTEPSPQDLAWTQPGFDETGWEEAPGGFGFRGFFGGHDFEFSTQLADMRRRYSSFYIRRLFQLDAETHAAIVAGEKLVRLRVSFDDGYVAYLNGREVGRRNAPGAPGARVPFNATAIAAEDDTDVIAVAGVDLQEGDNVLALQGLNTDAGDRDFFIGAELTSEDVMPPEEEESDDDPFLGRVLNEVKPTVLPSSPGFIELFNRFDEPLDLSDHGIVSSRGDLFLLPASFTLASGAHRSFLDTELGFEVKEERAVYLLLAPDGVTIRDSLEVEPRGDGNSVGRFPDGDEDTFVMTSPTPGAANSYTADNRVVLHEIYYSPPFVPPTGDCSADCSDRDQWIELYNSGDEEVSLRGWRLTKGVLFDFGDGDSIPAGGYLVVAASVDAFRAAHPGVENVVGGWTRRLSRASDTINLRDALGNRVDHVKYSDGRPRNDEAPEDGIDDGTFRGSFWPQDTDRTGRSIELVHPELDNRAALAWRSSAVDGGTPGAANSTHSARPPPTVHDVGHEPVVPRSTESVEVTSRISSVAPITTAEVRWAVDGGPQGTAALLDDGLSGDGEAGDGRYGAVIPPQADGAIVRFSIFVADANDESTLVPLPPRVAPYGGFAGPFYLYEVDDSIPPANGGALYRIILRPADREHLQDRDLFSNVLLPGTFIDGDKAFYLVGVRYRGENSRREPNRSCKVRFHHERLFQGTDNLNLNAANGGRLGVQTVSELLAFDLYRRAGAPYAQTWPVTLHFAGEVDRDFDTRYLRKEALDEDFLTRFFGGSDGGSLYRARNPGGPGRPSGDLSFRGDDPGPYRDIYDKRTHEEEDNYDDIIDLCAALDPARTPDGQFAARVESIVDARQWAQFFAVMACLTNTDGGIWNNNGEDYFLYRVPADRPRSDAGKWLLLPWDLEETFEDSDERLFRPTVPAIQRFLSHPRFARLYYEELRKLAEGPFSRAEMRQRFGPVSVMFPPSDVFDVVDPLDAYTARRLGYYDESIPDGLETGAGGESVGTLVISAGDAWRYFRGRQDPPGESSAWTAADYDDASWEEGPSGFGYGDGDDATVLGDMQGPGGYLTLYLRRRFQVEDPDVVTSMTLRIDFDDAFVAYINGQEVARSATAPAGLVSFDDNANGDHEASAGGGDVETYDVSAAIPLLEPDGNVLAVVGLNGDLNSSDFSLIPELGLSTAGGKGGVSGGCGDALFAQGGSIPLRGMADPVTTSSVVVNGKPARFSLITGGNGPYGAVWETTTELVEGENVVTVEAHAGADGSGELVESLDLHVRSAPGGFGVVAGALAEDTVWAEASSPYRLRGDLEVLAGVTLTVEPGTVVLAEEDASIRVRGLLLAEGTEERPILFRPLDCADRWGGIAFLDTGTGASGPTHVLRHCDLAGGSTAPGQNGFLAPVSSRLLVDECLLSDLAGNGIDGRAARVEVLNTRFHEIFEGVHCTNSVAFIEDCVFQTMIGDTDAVDFDGGGAEPSRIERSVFVDATDDAIDVAGCTVDIRDNVFSRVGDKAISIEEPGAQGSPAITGNLIFDCGTGMALKDGVDVQEGHHNTVVGCQEGISLYAKDNGPVGGNGVFHSLIVWDNVVNVYVDSRSSATFEHSDIGFTAALSELWPGEGNLAADPVFTDSPAGDFSLQAGSPCIGTGLDGTDMGAIPHRDVGIFLRGDTDPDGELTISDAVRTLQHLFLGGDAPECRDILDTNDDGGVNISDAIYTLRFLFLGGDPIPPPYPEAGRDPTPDALECK